MESEIAFDPTDNLSLNATLGYLDAEFDEFDRVIAGEVVDASDDPIGGPELQASVSARYEFDLTGGNVIGVQGNYSWVDEDPLGGAEVVEAFGEELSEVDSYGLVNGQIDFNTDAYGGVNIALFGTNLFDKEHFTGGLAIASFGVSNRFIGAPRQYGVRVKKTF